MSLPKTIIKSKLPSKSDLESFIYKWNTDYPIDRWWREKHKVAFNSPEHRVVSFLDLYIEWKEDEIYNKAMGISLKNSLYRPDEGDWLTEQEVNIQKETIDFEKLDLSKFDDK